MNFQDLLSRMRQLDTPSAPVVDKPVGECGDAMPPSNPMMPKPDTPPPSLSINMNAQGMDDIADIMKLIAKVNPDMEKPMTPPMPGMGVDPITVTAVKPLAPKPELPPLKMLPDLDSEPHAEPDADNMGGPSDMDADNMPGGMDGVSKAQGDQDNDGDHDMDDHDMEPNDDDKGDDKDDEKKEWANDPDPELKDTDYMVNKLAGGLNRPKTMTPHGYHQGDNPLAMTRESLRQSIKTELAQRLEEAKKSYSAKAARAGKDIGKPGKQFAKISKDAGERYGSKEKGEKVAGAVLAKLRNK